MNSVRDRETFKDIMTRYHANIVTLVDQAGIYCTEHKNELCDGCPFDEKKLDFACVRVKLAILLGVET